MPAIDYARQPGQPSPSHPADTSRITEILQHNSRISLPPLLLPIIAQLSRDDRWLTLINPPAELNRALLDQVGASTGHILVLRCTGAALPLCRQALAAGTSHTVILWCENGQPLPLKQLAPAAEQGNAQAILVRH